MKTLAETIAEADAESVTCPHLWIQLVDWRGFMTGYVCELCGEEDLLIDYFEED